MTKPTAPLKAFTEDAQTGPFGSQLHSEEYIEGGVPVINPSNIKDGRLIADRFSTVSTETAHRLRVHRLRAGDLVFARRGELGRAAVVSKEEEGWLCGTGSIRVRANHQQLDSHFAGYALQSAEIRSYFTQRAVGSTMGNLNTAIVLGAPIPSAPLEEQRRIADFLDAETARIDGISERTAAQVDLLKLRRRAFIDDHLTRQVEGGQQIPLRFVLRPSFDTDRPELQVLSVYRDFGIIPKSSRQDNFNKTPEDISRYLVVHQGDVVVNKMKAWQGSLGVSQHHGVVSPDYLVARVTADAYDLTYLHYLLRSPRLIAEYAVRSRGIRPSQWRLYWEDLADIRIPVVPKREQLQRIRDLEREDAWVENALSAMERRALLLTERRQALITAAVTGQFDVSTTSGRNVTNGVNA